MKLLVMRIVPTSFLLLAVLLGCSGPQPAEEMPPIGKPEVVTRQKPPKTEKGRAITELKKQGAEFKFDRNGKVVEVILSASFVLTDDGLKHLKVLKNLISLELGATKITDAGLEHVGELVSVQSLALGNTGITDAGLEHLKGLANLQVLDLSYTRITDAGLEHLKSLKNLRLLVLLDTNVTDEGVKKLQKVLPMCRIAAVPR